MNRVELNRNPYKREDAISAGVRRSRLAGDYSSEEQENKKRHGSGSGTRDDAEFERT
jgi:hypothetical protein